MQNRFFLCIDLKSFYASVECMERGLDPLTTHLVVADALRTEKTICLAVSPSLKEYGISGRARLFEVVERVKWANAERRKKLDGRQFAKASYDAKELAENPEFELTYIAAPPRMAHYMEYSAKIYQVYLKYVAPEDIHVYSIDEVFMDITQYLPAAGQSAREFAKTVVQDVLHTTGITATAGIGTNLYLAKIAMDIVSKHSPADEDGVRLAELDEEDYRRQLWSHRPITDFWRVGHGYAKRLYEHGLYTMGDIARCSIGKPSDYYNEDLLYRIFGINAELLIDHAWGWEPCTIAHIKQYKPSTNSISSGQVLSCPYDFEKTRLIVREMADALALDLVDKALVTDQIVLTIGYDVENLADPERRKAYQGKVKKDFYGRKVPEHAHGTTNLSQSTSSARLLIEAATELYDKITVPSLLIRRLNIVANHVVPESTMLETEQPEQLMLFTDYDALEQQRKKEKEALDREKQMQKAMLDIKKKFGKNAILKGMNLQEGATAKQRNEQIGGHKA